MPRHRNSDAESLFITTFLVVTAGIGIFLYKVHKKKLWLEFFTITAVIAGIDYCCYHTMMFKDFLNILYGSFGVYLILWVFLFSFRKVFNNSHGWLNEHFWRNLEPFQFEEETAQLFRAMGHKARVTPERGDYGVDVIAVINGTKTAIQCKRYNGHKVTCEEVRDLWGAKDYYDCKNVIMIGLDGVTTNARRFISRFERNYKVMTLKDLMECAEGLRYGNRY